jgi:hypothetical protein
MVFELLTLICASFFASAAAYVSFVEHPARLACGTQIAMAEWRPSYKRAAPIQVTLVVVGTLSAIVACATGQGVMVLAGGLLLALMVPYTLIVVMPTNRELLNPSRPADASSGRLLEKWGRLHMVRTVSGLIAVVIIALDLLQKV